jgi:hypothetical protein
MTPEAAERLARQRRSSTISALVISFLVIGLLALILALFLLPSWVKESPTIVSYSSGISDDDDLSEKKVKTSVDRKPSAPSSANARVIASATAAPVAIPTVDVVTETESLDFGSGDDFGAGWESGDSMGAGGGGATFFNQKVSASRIAYVIDYSASMRSSGREKLMRSELSKSIKGLAPGTNYQLFFFAGPVWVAGDKVSLSMDGDAKNSKGTSKVTAPDGEVYKWTGVGMNEWTPVGSPRKVPWLPLNERTQRKSLDQIKDGRLVPGTDWENPLEMAMAMDPPPQVIFFMTDGVMGGRNMDKLTRDLGKQAKEKGIVINTIALMEPRAEESMFDLAKRAGGVFTIVDKRGKSKEVKRLDKDNKGKKRR